MRTLNEKTLLSQGLHSSLSCTMLGPSWEGVLVASTPGVLRESWALRESSIPEQSPSVTHQLVCQVHPPPSLILFWRPCLEVVPPLPPPFRLQVTPQSGSVGLSHQSACLSVPAATPHLPLPPPWLLLS